MSKDVDIKEIPDTNDLIVVNKTNIKNIIKNIRMNNDTLILEHLNDVVFTVHKIVIHTYQFLKMYLIHLYDNKKDFPIIDISFIRIIMKVVTKRKSNGSGRQPMKETLIIMKQL